MSVILWQQILNIESPIRLIREKLSHAVIIVRKILTNISTTVYSHLLMYAVE